MNTQEIIIAQCSHPQLVMWTEFPDNAHFRCSHCGKELVVDVMGLIFAETGKHATHAQDNHVIHQRATSLIAEAFGEPWRDKVLHEATLWEPMKAGEV